MHDACVASRCVIELVLCCNAEVEGSAVCHVGGSAHRQMSGRGRVDGDIVACAINRGAARVGGGDCLAARGLECGTEATRAIR